MASDTMIYKPQPAQPKALFATSKVEAKAKRPLMELDMGEGSRLQGFRLNGCR